jgi:hypothetical protein
VTDRIRTLADDALSAQKDTFGFWMAQSDVANKQLQSAWDVSRASLEAARDLNEKLVRAWVDAVLPANAAAAAAAKA